MADNDKNLKIEAIRCASGIHCAHVAKGEELKESDVVENAKKIYEFLKD